MRAALPRGAPTRHIVVPEEPSGNGSPRPPRLTEEHQLFGCRPRPQALHVANGSRKRDVPDRPDVRAAEHHEQVDRRRPAADPGDRLEREPCRVVVEGSDDVEVERAIDEGGRKRPRVARLLAAEPDGQELGVGQLEEARGCGRVGGCLQPVVGSAGRGERDLLLEDDVDEGPEPGRAIPERRRPEALDDRGEVVVAPREFFDGRRERRFVERVDQATVPRSPNPTAGSGSNGLPDAPRSHARAFPPSDGR